MADVGKMLETMHPLREPPPPASVAPYLVMLALGCAIAGTLIYTAWRLRRQRNALLGSAESALAAARRLTPPERIAAQAHLLRRLVRSLSGDDAARASGEVWLQSLDRLFTTRFFTEGAGRIFGDGLYRPIGDVDVVGIDRSLSALLAQVRLPKSVHVRLPKSPASWVRAG